MSTNDTTMQELDDNLELLLCDDDKQWCLTHDWCKEITTTSNGRIKLTTHTDGVLCFDNFPGLYIWAMTHEL